jgi:hypothetical protein
MDPPASNFPLGPGDAYTPNGGRFSATNIPLSAYLGFAYKLVGNQAQSLLDQLPDALEKSATTSKRAPRPIPPRTRCG